MERSAYRIIDANFNRAREALRVIEDYCRFALNNHPLSIRAKDLRHRLCATISQLASGRLLAARDTPGDVGIGQVTENTLSRINLKDSLTAACKRLPEALRVLSETIRPEDTSSAEQVEKLRYESYTLEKDIAISADTKARFDGVRLYVIISSNLPADIFSLAERCITGGADCLQLRAKEMQDDALFAISCEFVKMCRDVDILGIINDRVDIAVASGADGVHLGQNDISVKQARKLQLSPLIIGKSTHTPAQLAAAISEMPTYVSLGPIFPTPTKPDAEAVTLDYVKQSLPVLSQTGIGHVAIGGITEGNIDSVLIAGVKTVAVSSAVTKSPDPTAACKNLRKKIADFCDKK